MSFGVSMKALPILLAPLCFMIAAFAAATYPNEPTYQGRSLSDWTNDLDPHGRVNRPAWTAIGHIGTNAIPTLLRWMSEPDPPEPPKTNVAGCFNTSRSERAELAFRILGGTAHPAIPELTRLARASSDPERPKRCAASLSAIGPQAIPSLLSLATNGPPWTRYWAVNELGWFARTPEAVQTVPVLIKCLDDTNTLNVDGSAERALMNMDPAVAVPALTNALHSPLAQTRLRIARCLLALEDAGDPRLPSEAPTIVSACRTAVRDPDPQVRSTATNILRRIGGREASGANKAD